MMSLPKGTARKHTPQTVEFVRTLSGTMTDNQNVAHLNEAGLRTPEGRAFTVDSIKWIRYLNHIPALSNHHKGLTVKDVAERFEVGVDTVYYWIYHGVLHAEKAAPGWLGTFR